MEKSDVIRRSISIPKELDTKIEIMKNEYSYSVKNELIVYLIELGIIKFTEETELKNRIKKLLDNIEIFYEKLGIK